MAPSNADSETLPGDESDSFEALLREVAKVSVPPQTSSLTLPLGAALAGGRLSVLRRVGEGGMGVVYEAFDTERRTRVALKTLSRLDAVNVYRLKNEFRALADVRHPNLVRLHELFAEHDSWFFTMELIAGDRFDAWMTSGPERKMGQRFDEARLRAQLPQLLAAIGTIHAAGKLHRDLKPSNVLVTPQGRTVVLDFGLVTTPSAHATDGFKVEDGLRGTPAYMAPEQAAGQPATAASDLYALGVMLFEVVTGRLPFMGRVPEILHAKQRETAPRASSMADVPPDLDELIASLLALSPDARPDLASVVARFGAPGSVPPPTRNRARDSSGDSMLLVGRDAELSALRDAYQAASAGTPIVLRIAGPSGIGKSALLEAFMTEVLSERRAVLLSGRCHERENVPYKGVDALVDDLSRYLRSLPRDEAAALMPRGVDSLSRLFPVLARVTAIAEAPRRTAPDAHDLQRRAFAAFGELLGRIRDRQPLVICIDDLQWTDPDSVRFIRFLLLHPDPTPLMMVAVQRTDRDAESPLLSSLFEAASDNRRISSRAITLPPLTLSALVTVARARLGHLAQDDAVAETIAREAQGYPLFAVELARHVAHGALDSAPPSLEETLASRVRALPDDARRLLTISALAGQPVAQAVAVDAAGLGDVHAALDMLIDERLLRTAIDASSTRVVDCFHERVRAWVLRDLSATDARLLSQDLAHTLTAQGVQAPALLSHVWETAGDLAKAAECAAIAAADAARAFAFDHAAAFYERALRLSDAYPGQQRPWYVGRAQALASAGRGPVAAEAFLLAREGATDREHAELTRKAGEQYVLSGNLLRGRELLAEGLSSLGIDLPLSPVMALSATIRSRLQLRIGRWEMAREVDNSPLTLERLDALSSAAIALSRTDPLRTADFTARWALLARSSGQAVSYASALGWELSLAGLLRTSPQDVMPMERVGAALCAQSGSPLGQLWFHYGRGGYHLMRGQPWSGNFKLALSDFERCVQLLKVHPHATASYDEPWVQYQRANALTMLGRFTEAHRIAQVQMEAAWSQHDLTILPAWAMTASYVRCALGDAEQAERDLARTRAVWQADDLSFQDLMLPAAVMVLAAYRGQERLGYQTCEAMLERFYRRWMGRVFFASVTASLRAIWGAAAASGMRDDSERRALVAQVRRASRQAQRWEPTLGTNARAALACAEGNVEAAVLELRRLLTTPEITPTWDYAARRRLGVLIGGDEGRALVHEADAFFQAGGVVDSERFTACVLPGLEIRRSVG